MSIQSDFEAAFKEADAILALQESRAHPVADRYRLAVREGRMTLQEAIAAVAARAETCGGNKPAASR